MNHTLSEKNTFINLNFSESGAVCKNFVGQNIYCGIGYKFCSCINFSTEQMMKEMVFKEH